MLPAFSVTRSATLAMFSLIVLAGCHTPPETSEPIRNALVAHPQNMAAQAEVYSGEVRARYQSVLAFRIAGKIKLRKVDMGAVVAADDVLAELDPSDVQLQVASAHAALSAAEADAALAASEHERYRSMTDKHLVSASQFEAKDNALKAAVARVAEARSALTVAENQASYATLRADHAGIITTISAEAGQVVAAGQSVATLAHEGDLEVEINVPESRIEDYRKNSAAIIELWAQSGKPLSGHLREIAPEADRATRTYAVRIAIDANDAAPRLGQTARVYFTHTLTTGMSLIPLSSLYEQNGNPAVWIVDPQKRQVHLQPITIGAYRENGVTVSAGLDITQWIVTAGVHKLHEGQIIRPIDTNNRDQAL